MSFLNVSFCPEQEEAHQHAVGRLEAWPKREGVQSPDG